MFTLKDFLTGDTRKILIAAETIIFSLHRSRSVIVALLISQINDLKGLTSSIYNLLIKVSCIINVSCTISEMQMTINGVKT